MAREWRWKMSVLIALAVFNTITNVVIIAIFIRQAFFGRIEISWRETFWMKDKYGVEVTLWDKELKTGNVYGFDFRPEPTRDYERYKEIPQK
jgi:hypothetical protein